MRVVLTSKETRPAEAAPAGRNNLTGTPPGRLGRLSSRNVNDFCRFFAYKAELVEAGLDGA
jgi:hypothetical protein